MDTNSELIVGGIKVNYYTADELADQFLVNLKENKNKENIKAKLVFSSNGQGVALAGRNISFRKLMEKADYVHPDGMSVVWASILCQEKLKERVSTTDFVHIISEKLNNNEKNIKYFLLGANERENQLAKKSLENKYPNIKIVGRANGYFDDHEYLSIVEKINILKPDIVWVGMGKPKQEFLSEKLQNDLHHTTWIKTCGGLFEFLAGTYTRAPMWMQKIGLEWLYRLIKNPNKLLFRYISTNTISIYLYLTKSGVRKGINSVQR